MKGKNFRNYIWATACIQCELDWQNKDEDIALQLWEDVLRVCPREDQADVTHAISPICLKLSQEIKVIELFKSPR